MPSTFTSNTGIEKIADGEQTGAWGQTTNDNFDIVDRALNGSVNVTLSGTTHTLTTADGVLSDGQFAVLVFTGSLGGTNTVTIEPDTAQKTYFVRNTTAQSVVLTQGSGANVTVPAGRSAVVSSNGGGASAAVVDLSAGLVPVLANDGVTATTAELNILDGVTATTAELNILDGVTATTAELNILDGVTATTAELNVLDGVTATTAELNVLDGIAGIASQAEAEAGTNNTTLMTPLRASQTARRFGNPAGTIIFYAADTAPEGYLKANGAAVSRTTYAALFAAISTTYGAGDGSTTFKLPDQRGEFPRGWDDGRGVDSGRAFGTLQLDQMQRITGAFGIRRSDAGGLSETTFNTTGAISNGGLGGTNASRLSTTSSLDLVRLVNFNSADSPDARVSSTTSGETRSRNVALLACIKF